MERKQDWSKDSGEAKRQTPALIPDITRDTEKETKCSDLMLINSFLFCPFFIVPRSNYVSPTLSPNSSPCIKLSQIKSDSSQPFH